MIGYLSGKVVAKISTQIIVKTPSGVGYLVHVNPTANFMTNENVEIYIFEVRRDDKAELFGFTSRKDREWINTLLKVSGVGPKMAANIIYILGWKRIDEAVQGEDVETFSNLKGLGVKTAKKIVLELKGVSTNLAEMSIAGSKSQTISDFSDALSSLGYKKGEIVRAISQMKKDKVWEEENLVGMVKVGLKYLGR